MFEGRKNPSYIYTVKQKQLLIIKTNNMKKTNTPWTNEEIEFVFDNYLNKSHLYSSNPKLCKTETNHSLGSVKLMIKNVVAHWGIIDNFGGNSKYAEIADKWITKHNMSRVMFNAKFRN